MKKVISTIVAIGFFSSMLVNTAHAGGHHGGGINPLWIPVAIISTLAAVTIAQQPPVVHERHIIYEPRQVVVRYEKPRHYRHTRYYERDHEDDESRYRDYR